MVVEPVAAFVAGLIAFFSPCILPIVPGFLAFITQGAASTRRRRLLLTLLFTGGFTVAFTVIGFLIGAAGSTATFQAAEVWLRRVGGVFIIVFGFAMLGLLRFPWMDRDLRYHGRGPAWLGPYGTATVMGAAFGVGWTPCVGPILGSIIVLAGIEGGAMQGGLLLSLFSLGLAIPFLIFGSLADLGSSFMQRYARFTQVVEIVGGVFLVLLGIMVFTGAANRLLAVI